MTIVLVRHGETAGNAQRVLQLADTPLNARGIRQAELLAPRLQQLGVGHILCSDLTRARMTAEPLVALTGLTPELSSLLQERNFGDLRGTPHAEVPGNPFAPDFVPPGGEDLAHFHVRVARAFEWIVRVKQRVPGNLVVVTHGLVCGALLRNHARQAPDQPVLERFGNTGVTVLEARPPHRVQLLDCTQHLAAHPELCGALSGGAV